MQPAALRAMVSLLVLSLWMALLFGGWTFGGWAQALFFVALAIFPWRALRRPPSES